MTEEIQLPPQSMDAERSVLGCMMLDTSKIASVASILKASDFYADGHKKAFGAILSLENEGIEADPLTVADKMEANGTLDTVGGGQGLLEIMQSLTHASHAVYYARIVLENSQRRQAIAMAKRLMDGAYDQTSEIGSLFNSTLEFANKLADVAAEVAKQKVSTLEDETRKAAEKSAEGSAAALFITMPPIDQATRGFALGELVVAGGRPGHGKSAMCLQMIDQASLNGVPGLIISEEMSKEAMAERALAFITTLSPDERYGQLQRLQYDHREHFKNRAPVLIAEDCGSIGAIEREVARAVRTHKIQITGIDYAQLLKGDGSTRYEQVSDVSRRAKQLARKHNIIVLLLAQLGRDMEKRSPPEPRLIDLKDSGQLEQDADVVIFPYWPWKVDQSYEDKGEYRFYMAKNRARGVGDPVVKMRFNPARQMFYPETQDNEPYVPNGF